MIDLDQERRAPRETSRRGTRAALVRMLRSDLVRFVRYVPADSAYPATLSVPVTRLGT